MSVMMSSGTFDIGATFVFIRQVYTVGKILGQSKYVLRLRCVCKTWCSLISEPQLMKTHLNRAITDLSVGCQRVLKPGTNNTLISIDYEALQRLSKKELEQAMLNNGGNANACTVFDLPWTSPDQFFEFVGSCHGMMALLVDSDKIVLCNPCTREFRELPKPTSINMKSSIHGGLGYDSYVDDYKFVIAVRDCTDKEFKAEVFSLRSNSWRIIQDIPPDIFHIYGFEQGVYLNGALHWIAICETGQQIISLDLATEKFQKLLSLPPVSNYSMNLILLGGFLSVSRKFSKKTEVWVMKEYGVEASWTKLFTLETSFLPDNYCHYLKPVCFSKNVELLVDVDNQIIIYNPKIQKFRKLYNGSGWLNDVFLYIESLVSPNGNVENNPHNITQ